MTDPMMLMVMRFLSRIQVIAYHVKPLMNPSLIVKKLEITISHGLSPAAPATFAYFGSHLAKLGDLSAGYRYAALGNALLNKLGLFYTAQVFFEQQDHKVGLAFNLITHTVVLSISGKENEAKTLEHLVTGMGIKNHPVPHIRRS
eukprot:scaffold32998_cov63-Cyclotella_meneghiniana.AAC.1